MKLTGLNYQHKMSGSRPGRRLLWPATAAAIVSTALFAGGLGNPASARADGVSYPVDFTTIGIYPRSAPDMASEKVGAAISDGTMVEIACELTGAAVDNGWGPNTIWERLSDGTYLPNAYVSTGTDSWTPGIAACSNGDAVEGAAPASNYNREAAVAFARENWDSPDRIEWLPDCTWFASSVLWSGSVPESEDWARATTDPEKSIYSSIAWFSFPTKTAMASDLLGGYLVSNGLAIATEVSLDDLVVAGAEPGDIIGYVWDTSKGDDGLASLDHVAVVTGTGGEQTLVAQHESSQLDKGWNWSAGDNDWVNMAFPNAKAYLIHITY